MAAVIRNLSEVRMTRSSSWAVLISHLRCVWTLSALEGHAMLRRA